MWNKMFLKLPIYHDWLMLEALGRNALEKDYLKLKMALRCDDHILAYIKQMYMYFTSKTSIISLYRK